MNNSIYIERFPGKTQELLKFIQNIRLSANRLGHLGRFFLFWLGGELMGDVTCIPVS